MNPERHQKLMGIVADAMECDTAERAVLLANSCADDEALRHDAERLLKLSKLANTFMEEPLFETATRWQEQQEQSVVGKAIGSYLVTAEIARGGMGAVYLAVRNDDAYRRQVAIKIVKRGMDTDLILRRFRNERQILANLDHQNIARLFDGGTTEDGRPYLVMEFVEGRAIHRYADEHSLSIKERLKLFLTVCDAVEYAHRHGVIHRDLKPGNIVVTNEGIPKLLDFGIAKVLYPEGAGVTADTTITALQGMTPEYASPEQMRGEVLSVASDIYSLGVLLYELLTGRRPFEVEHGAAFEIARKVCEATPEKPSTAVTRKPPTSDNGKHRQVNPNQSENPARMLAGDLDTIVLMALRKEPERRYASVAQFAEDIRRYLEGWPIVARKDAPAYRAAKFFKRNRRYVLTTAVVALLCIILGILIAALTGGASKSSKSIAVLPFTNISQDADTEYLSDGLTDSLISRFAAFPNLGVPARSSVFRYKGKQQDTTTIGRELGVETLLTGHVARGAHDQLIVDVSLTDAKNNSLIWTQQYRGDSSHFLLLQQEVVRDVLSKIGIEAHHTDDKRYPTDDEAYRLYLRGNYFWNRRNPEGFAKAIEYYQKAIERDPNYALAYDGLAKSYGLLGAYFVPFSENPFPKAKTAALKALELDPNLAEVHTSLALVKWLYDWDWAGADSEFRRAIELDPHYVTAHHWYGLYLGEMGRGDESIAELKRALELDPVSLAVYADLGRVYYWARRYDEALRQYHHAFEMEPTFGTIYAEYRYVLEAKKMYVEWFAAIDKVHDLNDEARAPYLKKDWLAFVRIGCKGGPPHDRAENCARAGDKDTAFQQLDLAFKEHDHRMSQLRVNAVWDPLRSDPRFGTLLRRMNL